MVEPSRCLCNSVILQAWWDLNSLSNDCNSLRLACTPLLLMSTVPPFCLRDSSGVPTNLAFWAGDSNLLCGEEMLKDRGCSLMDRGFGEAGIGDRILRGATIFPGVPGAVLHLSVVETVAAVSHWLRWDPGCVSGWKIVNITSLLSAAPRTCCGW